MVDISSQQSATDGLWPIYVISLPRASERRNLCQAQLDRLGVEFSFFDAVDGWLASEAEVAAVYDSGANRLHFKRSLTRPEIGCYLSHIELWRRIADGKQAGGIILEDDFEADISLPPVLRDLSRTAPRGFMIKLFSPRKAGGIAVAALPAGRRLVFDEHVSAHTTGYMIDREAARILLARSPPFWRPLDLDIKFWWETGVPVLTVEPPVISIGRLGRESAIEGARASSKLAGLFGLLVRFGRNFKYQYQYQQGKRRSRALRAGLLRRLAQGGAEKQGGVPRTSPP